LASSSWPTAVGVGQQVVPEDWADRATTAQVVVDGNAFEDGYGYQWWTATVDGEEAFRALGYGGQLIQVLPHRVGIIEDAIVSQFSAE
jgi:CubicO group peptidase (beta-lactamase class C family)